MRSRVRTCPIISLPRTSFNRVPALLLYHPSEKSSATGSLPPPRSDRAGINQSEKQSADNSLSAIDAIIATKPDVLVHAGDLFRSRVLP
jgi:hypothetical protein